jgi:hypothetical protein
LSRQFPLLSSSIPKLFQAYLRYPDQGGYAPKPEIVIKLMNFYLNSLPKLSSLELMHEILLMRLQRSSSMCQIVDNTSRQSLLSLIHEFTSLVETIFKMLFQTSDIDFQKTLSLSQSLLQNLSIYEVNVRNLILADPPRGVGSQPNEEILSTDPFLQWSTNPTIEWLTNGALYEQQLSLKRSYVDGQDYVNTVRAVWAMLTFYWGTAAFWPKCSCQSGGGGGDEARACGVPLLTHIDHHRHPSVYCTRRNPNRGGQCGRVAVWRCMRRDHEAICQKCLIQRQHSLMGPYGVTGSTDLYDATIQSVQLHSDDHVLHLQDVLSRKPPKEKVNWKTTYRLQGAMLVGVVHLHARNSELKPSMKIHWGEIVVPKNSPSLGKQQQGTARDEHLRRKDNLMSIRLLSRSDCPDLQTSRDLRCSKDSHVAIIDMRVFVPEVMTVLSTLGQRSFLDGFTRVSFAKYLLSPDGHDDDRGEEGDESTTLPALSTTTSLSEHLLKAFESTTIDCIANLSESRKRILIQKICQLKVVQTLDRTQGEAFIHALMRPLHCTQGPPGTGKVHTDSLSLGFSFFLSLFLS